MSSPTMARENPDNVPIPPIVVELAGVVEPELVWHNELGGLTYRLGDRFVKWNPTQTGVDLRLEADRLRWLAPRHPAPHVIDFGSNSSEQWMVTHALPGSHAVGPMWRERRPEALAALAQGLRALHAIPIDDFPMGWAEQCWVGRAPESIGLKPSIDEPVLVHGDACAPNTLIAADGSWVGTVDFGDLSVGDRWADLAIASLSIDWNFGEGHQLEFFAAYGVEPDEERIRYYRALWNLES